MTHCLVCSNKKLSVLTEIDGQQIFECSNCYTAVIDTKKVTAKKILYNFKNYNANKEIYIKRHKELIKIIRKFVNKGQVLDIGAGFGLISKQLSENQELDVELLEPLIKPFYSLDLKLYKTNLQDFLKVNRKKYDLILLMDVLEHFNNPKQVLLQIHDLLSPGGKLVIQTPNYKSFMAKIVKKWAWWMVEDHKLIFSIKSLKMILIDAGYSISYSNTYEDFIDFKKNLDGNFLNIKYMPLRRISKLLFYLIFIPIYSIIKPLMWRLNLGGLIFVIATKQ